MTALTRPLAMSVFAGIREGFIKELHPYMPPGWGARISKRPPNWGAPGVDTDYITISPGRIVEIAVEGDGVSTMYVETPRLELLMASHAINGHHYFQLPEDWPYRNGGSYCISLAWQYGDADCIRQIGKYISTLGDDPHRRTTSWQRRNPPSYGAREQRRQRYIRSLIAGGYPIWEGADWAQVRSYFNQRLSHMKGTGP